VTGPVGFGGNYQQALAKVSDICRRRQNQDGQHAEIIPAAISGVNARDRLSSNGTKWTSYAQLRKFRSLAMPGTSVVYFKVVRDGWCKAFPATEYANGAAGGNKIGCEMRRWSQMKARCENSGPAGSEGSCRMWGSV